MDKSIYKNSYNEALEIWNNLENIKKDKPYRESKHNPMHPYYYFGLSQVRGFIELNGKTYAEYIKIWKNRY